MKEDQVNDQRKLEASLAKASVQGSEVMGLLSSDEEILRNVLVIGAMINCQKYHGISFQRFPVERFVDDMVSEGKIKSKAN